MAKYFYVAEVKENGQKARVNGVFESYANAEKVLEKLIENNAKEYENIFILTFNKIED